ncbi:DNA-3-methyladenine glycosylase 2 family protein [uncultured Tateyamaria sp.]|uniref:DNA-3-methyladenine glycosylase family protein n=1 Tax=uncultured Tateyamaria sp. TaxID=455651 RepID=UPI0026389648|nr:DNA-3-methyladenine glycosylase 2 family protein [uncultured Tateyamaria sp.]
MTGRIIDSNEDVTEGATWLASRHPALADALELAGPLPLRRRPDGFAALLNAIIGQQVSTASANAIWARMQEAGLVAPAPVIAAGEDGLRAAGLSRQKIAYALALAEAGIDYDALRHAPDTDVIATLTAVKGIGVWTAEIYAMFALGRADVFAPGDLALQEAARLIFDLPERPKEKVLRQMANDWSPWRAVAARLFFTYYRVAKGREGIT